MAHIERQRLIFHGAAVLFIAMLCGVAAAVGLDDGSHPWRAANVGLMTTGIWLLVTAAVCPALALERREASGLAWSQVAMAYGLTTAFLIEALTGVRGITPVGPTANALAFAGNATGLLGASLGTLLTMLGARAALKADAAGNPAGRSAAP